MGYTTIDINKLNEWLDSTGKSNYEIALTLGRGPSFFSHVRSAGRMQEAMYSLLCKYYDLPQDALTPDKPAPAPVIAPPAEEQKPTASDKHGYWTETQIYPNKVKFSLIFSEQGVDLVVAHAYSRINGDTELALAQAISYAAHMVYKMVEQNTLEKR